MDRQGLSSVRRTAAAFLLLFLTLGSQCPCWGITTFFIKRSGADEVFRVFAAGDIMRAGSAGPVLREKGWSHPFGDRELLGMISTADVSFANLEYPVTLHDIRCRDKAFAFRGDPSTPMPYVRRLQHAFPGATITS
jgi:hypothetical protein